MYSIREMTIADYDNIINIWKNTEGIGLSNADSKENIEAFLNKNKNLNLVCENLNNEIIGTIMCGSDGRRAHIYHLLVVEKYRKQGIGQKLVSEIFMKLKNIGIEKSHIFVLKNNQIGNNFWQKNNWIKRDDINLYSKNI